MDEVNEAGAGLDRFGRRWELEPAEGLVQEDVEAWNRVFAQLRPVGMAEQRSAQLKAAIVAGWIRSPKTAVEKRSDMETGRERTVYLFDGVEVGQMKPREVIWYGRQCELLFTEVTRFPDEEAKN